MRLADLQHEISDGIVSVKVTGEIDMSNAGQLREGLSAMTPNEALGLVLDLSDVAYMDSAGIHLVYHLRDSLRTRGQGLRLVVPHDSMVSDTLRLAGVQRGSDIVETVRCARQALLPPEHAAPCPSA